MVKGNDFPLVNFIEYEYCEAIPLENYFRWIAAHRAWRLGICFELRTL